MIDARLAAFLHEGLALHIGTRNERFEPSGVRAAALKVEDDGVHIVVYVARVVAVRILPALESNGHAAVVCCRPTDDRACQVKGVFAGQRAATARDRPFVMAQRERFVQSLERIGIPRIVVEHWVIWPSAAIRIKATALFDQTPRPGTGGPLA